ncbi:MAG: glycoside hydrolase family 13 protein [Oscillospiraceae bacterium]|nr:glycoside hydrolase family 13 protein [Oscillospiraceae bacterium]
MLNLSVCHIPGTVDIYPLDGMMHVRLRVQRGLLKGASLIYNCNKNLWHEFRDEAPMKLTHTDSELEYYSVSVPLTDTRFAYIFALSCKDGTVWYFSEEGLSRQYDHDLGYFSFFQYASQFPCDMMRVPKWVDTAVCYQIFPERFAMGRTGKDTGYLTGKWGDLPTPKSFFGGDLVGIREKLSYLSDLGITMLYMNPVFCSPSNHKYDLIDYETVDPEFGGNEALKALIEEAHRRGIRVMLDGVFNHCSWEHPFFKDAQANGQRSPYYNWFLWNEDGTYLTFGSSPNMPKLNTENPEVIRYFSNVAVKWMRDYGVDDWRLDVSDEISHRFLRAFREAVLAQSPDAVIIGEDWHRAVRYLNGDEYDSIMNYSVTKACLDLLAFRTIGPAEFRDRLVRLYHTYSVPADRKMLNLLGSHDTDRFLTRVGGDPRRFRAAAAIQFFYPGIPCVYYGDEIGTEGGYDPGCRRCFDWDETHWDKETRTLIQTLAKLKKEPALSVGDFAIEESEGIITLTRTAPEQTLRLRVNGTDHTAGGLPAYGFELVKE